MMLLTPLLNFFVKFNIVENTDNFVEIIIQEGPVYWYISVFPLIFSFPLI